MGYPIVRDDTRARIALRKVRADQMKSGKVKPPSELALGKRAKRLLREYLGADEMTPASVAEIDYCELLRIRRFGRNSLHEGDSR